MQPLNQSAFNADSSFHIKSYEKEATNIQIYIFPIGSYADSSNV